MSEPGLDVIERANAGDLSAFEEIYRSYGSMVYGVALRMMGRAEDAEEVSQDVFIAVHRNLKDFAGKSSLKTWIYRITVNAALNAIKKNKRRWPELRMDEGVDFEDPRKDVSDAVDRESREKDIEELLAVLNSDQKACLVLRAQEGLSYEEIAQALNININTVRSRLKRAREVLIEYRRKKG